MARVVYREEHDALSDRKVVILPELYALSTSTECGGDENYITAEEIMQSEQKNRTVAKYHLQWDLRHGRITSTEMVFDGNSAD